MGGGNNLLLEALILRVGGIVDFLDDEERRDKIVLGVLVLVVLFEDVPSSRAVVRLSSGAILPLCKESDDDMLLTLLNEGMLNVYSS